MRKIICALVALGVSGSALAWGEREQGALAGAVIGALIAKESQRPVGYAQGYGYGQVGYGSAGYGQGYVQGYGYGSVGYGQGYVQGYAPGVQVHPQLGIVQPVQVCQLVQMVDQYGRYLGTRQNCRTHY